MKCNVRFFVTVIALLIVSTSVLAVCMHAISKDNGESKDYYNESTSNIGGSSDDDPLIGVEIQNIMIEKFNEMKQISEDGKEITVISDDYLNKYWNTTQIRSLTTTEVYYIIQDSIRLYAEYDRIILPGVGAADNADRIIPENMPCFASGGVIEPQSKKPAYYTEEDMVAIYKIIYYRIKALSSPKAFFTGDEAILYADGVPSLDSSWLPRSTFYIPEYSESTDRNGFLSIIGSVGSSHYNELPSDLFVFLPHWNMIEFLSKTSGRVQTFPTVEMEKQMADVYYVSNEGAYFRLDKNGGFVLSESVGSPPAITGTYHFDRYYENTLVYLVLSVDDEHNYVFYETADGGYLYSRENSTPIDHLGIEDGTKFEYKVVVGDNLDGNVSQNPSENEGEHDSSDKQLTITMTIAQTLPGCDVFEYKDEKPYCFYAYDSEGKLYRIFWSDFTGLNEKDVIIVEYEQEITALTYDEYPSGWTPKYEVMASGIKMENRVNKNLVGHITISSGNKSILPFGRLLWSKKDNGDGTFSEMFIDTWDIIAVLRGDGPTPLSDIPVLVLDGGVTYAIQANGRIENVYLYISDGDSFIKMQTSFEALSDLDSGTYYVVFDVGLYGNCAPDVPQNSYLYEDAFCLIVG